MLVGFGRITTEIRPIQIIPFETISKFFSKEVSFYSFFINIICNIFLFVPFGFLGLIFKSFNSIKIILPIFIFAIMVMEFLQTISGRGYGEVDDVILNTTGMLTGFALMKYLKAKNSNKILKESEI